MPAAILAPHDDPDDFGAGDAAECRPTSTRCMLHTYRGRCGIVWRLHDAGMKIRDAVIEDAPAACVVLRRSIIELCTADHGDDPEILQRWLANKTPEIVASWIVRTGSSVLLAVESAAILAVGAVTDAGEITLNYVSPDARFRGVSRALLDALEARAVARGNICCRLHSNGTARRFYHAAGYCEDGSPNGKFGPRGGYPMSKLLPAL